MAEPVFFVHPPMTIQFKGETLPVEVRSSELLQSKTDHYSVLGFDDGFEVYDRLTEKVILESPDQEMKNEPYTNLQRGVAALENYLATLQTQETSESKEVA